MASEVISELMCKSVLGEILGWVSQSVVVKIFRKAVCDEDAMVVLAQSVGGTNRRFEGASKFCKTPKSEIHDGKYLATSTR
jgi:hypothetical protein